ncbi:unnamed protein product [marine sediment metagenome]|uniref:Uncharacterized protein n=1 Tax=marine sediment metagenome TaxID=412755 RepID=X1TAX2_9ZZZZ
MYIIKYRVVVFDYQNNNLTFNQTIFSLEILNTSRNINTRSQNTLKKCAIIFCRTFRAIIISIESTI